LNINVVVLSGNLTKDPEAKTVGDQALTKLRIAVNKSTKKSGEWVDSPMFFDVDVWGRTAEVCAQYLARGSKVTVKGRLDWREWETDAGEKRQAVSVVAEAVELPTKKEAEQQRQQPASHRPPDPEPPEPLPADDGDDDIPF